MKILKQNAAFRELIRIRLIPKIIDAGYKTTFDSEIVEKKEPQDYIYKQVFTGANKIEISNSDWRDFIEYFEIYINDIEITSINIMKYSSIEEAYNELNRVITQNLV
jgi:hypothetical protein